MFDTEDAKVIAQHLLDKGATSPIQAVDQDTIIWDLQLDNQRYMNACMKLSAEGLIESVLHPGAFQSIVLTSKGVHEVTNNFPFFY